MHCPKHEHSKLNKEKQMWTIDFLMYSYLEFASLDKGYLFLEQLFWYILNMTFPA